MDIDDTRGDPLAGTVHHDRVTRRLDARADGDDAAVLQENRAALNLLSGRRHDRRIADDDGRTGMTLIRGRILWPDPGGGILAGCRCWRRCRWGEGSQPRRRSRTR